MKKNVFFCLQLPISHCVPLKPGAQLQLNPLTRSVQVPLLLQGSLAQSSISGFEDEIKRKNKNKKTKQNKKGERKFQYFTYRV